MLIEPDVIPLDLSGACDTDQHNITSTQLMAQGLANLWKEGREGAYAVRYGQQPVKDFGRLRAGEERSFDPGHENYFVKAFPVLFPYGRGGLEAD
jgi:hypothetical protein